MTVDTDRRPVTADVAPRPGWRRRPELVVVVLWLVVFGPFVQVISAQGAPRLAMTGAMVDDQTLVIDGYLLGVDFATRDGHTYSDKAPGQSILAIPGYAAARLVGAEPARVHRVEENLTLWWVSLISGGLPLAVGVWLMGAAMRRRGMSPQVPVLAGITFGTMLTPLASNLYGHVLAGVLAFAAWSVLDVVPRPRAWRGAAAGLLAGAAVAVEYQVLWIVVVLGVWLLLRRWWSGLAGMVAGGVPVAAALMLYQWASAGSVVRSGYQNKEWQGQSGFFSTHVTHPPDPRQMLEILIGTRGLLVFTPVVLLGLVGLVRRWRRERDDAALVGLAALAGLFLLQASWANTWAGSGPGPRYIAPALPFLAVGLAEAWKVTPAVLRAAALMISIATMGLATVTDHLMTEGSLLGIAHLQRLTEDGPTPTIFTIGLGPVGWVLHVSLVAGVLVLLARAPGPGQRTHRPGEHADRSS